MATTVEEAVALGVATVAAFFFALAGLVRLLRIDPRWTGFFAPAALIAAYVLAYGKVPTFPPVGSVNKVFYVMAAGTVVGGVLDLGGAGRLGRWLAITQPAAAALWIGWPRLPAGWPEIVAAAALGVLLQLSLLERARETRPGRGDDVDQAVLLAAACLGFAPIALLGASSSSLQLCLTAAVAIGAALLWHTSRPRYRFGFAARLGAVGGFLAVADTVVLITRKAEPLAILALATIVAAPRLAAVLDARLGVTSEIIRRGVFALCCLVPAGAGIVLALALYPSAFPG